MRIAIFDGSFETTAFIRRLIRGLVQAGHEVYVLGFNEKIKEAIQDVHYVPLGSNQKKIKFLRTSLLYALKSRNFLSVFKHLVNGKKKQVQQFNLSYVLNSIKPDVIHLQWVSNIKLFEDFLQEKQYKFILSQRGYQTNVRPFIDADNLKYLQKCLPYFSGFHSVSKAISDKGDQIFHSRNKLDQVVYTGLDLKEFLYQKQVVNNDKLRLLSVGRPHWIKGYDIAIEALAMLKEKQIPFNYRIIGASQDEELLFLLYELELQNDVELLSKMPQSAVFEEMKAADIFLLPSLEEGIANVAVEAMALGTPVLSTDCGGMQELITHQKEGWIVPTYDVHAMAEQIEKFTQVTVEELKKIKWNARKKAEMQHNEQQMVEGMLHLYSRVAEN